MVKPVILQNNINNKDKVDKHPCIRCEHVDGEGIQTV